MSESTLDVTIVFLEMHRAPTRPAPEPPRPDLTIVRASDPTVSFYRYLYGEVGRTWLWYERRRMGDGELAAIVKDPAVEVHVLYVGGVPAGYAELDRREPGQIELAYFGLIPAFIGAGLGAYFLAWSIDRAWSYQPARLWVHTCSLDHPRALPTYVNAGFAEYARKSVRIPDPRLAAP
jgi:GNAT superfamily N-acetyltransferase